MAISASRSLFLVILAALGAGLIAQESAAQDSGRDKIECYTCRDTGLVPCEDHKASADWCRDFHFYCSECMKEQACCRGRGYRPCDCVDRDWENLVLDPGYELFDGGIEARQPLVEFMKADPIYLVTEHFFVMSTLEGMKLSPNQVEEMSADLNPMKKNFPWVFRNLLNISPHAMAHLYAHRLEKIYEKYCEAIGVTVEEDRGIPYSGRLTEVFLCGQVKEQKAWQARHGGASLTSGSSGKFALSPLSSPAGGRHRKSYGPNVSGDTNFHDGVIHLTSRCLLERFFCRQGGKFPPGWLKVGFPHWMEQQILKQCSYYLVNIEVKGLSEEWVVSGWDRRAVSLARRSNTVTFPVLSKKDFADLGFREHVLAWSFVDFVLRNQPREKFRDYWDNLRSRMHPRDSLLTAYDWSELTLENNWRCDLLMQANEFEDLSRAERFVAEFDRALLHPDLETRASASYFLKYSNTLAAAERILQAFQESEVVVRASALAALKEFESEAALRWVVENGLTHASERVRRNTAIALGTMPGLLEITLPLLLKLLEDGKAAARAGAVRALGELHPDEAFLPVADMATDKSPEVRVECALALWNFREDGALTQVLTLLRDEVWAVRLASIRSLHYIEDKRMIPALIERLRAETGRLREDILDLLVKKTHQDYGLKPDRWTWWWNTYGGDFKFGAGKSKSQEHKIRYAIQYHEVETCSKKFIFLVDTSSSMNEIVAVEKVGGKTYGKGDLNKKKINVAQIELVRLLREFDKNILFNIITFNDEVGQWKKNVVAASGGQRKQAEKYVWDIKPPDKAATNIYDALMMAFDMVDAGFAKRKYESVVDTMFLLSDGRPTAGAVTDVDMILRTVRERNRVHGIKIHTFSLGGRSGDPYFLKKLAEITGGQYQVIRVR